MLSDVTKRKRGRPRKERPYIDPSTKRKPGRPRIREPYTGAPRKRGGQFKGIKTKIITFSVPVDKASEIRLYLKQKIREYREQYEF